MSTILATLCYLKNSGRTLMLQRAERPGDIHAGKWNGLGGKFLPGESPEECAKREIAEESGLLAAKLELRGVITFPLFDGEHDWYVFVYTAPEFSGSITPSPEGRVEWIPDEKLLSLELWEGDRIFLPWLSEQRFFSAKFCYQNGVLHHHEVTFHGSAAES